MQRISTNGLAFVDEYGRERIFNGMNVSDKDPSNIGEVHKNSTDLSFLDGFVKRGINVIRLGFNWVHIEPNPGEYNEKFIDSIERFFDACEQKGIYVFLDVHQDLYSHVCYGDGAPKWATITEPYTAKKQKFVWAEGYFIGKACHRAFDNFWNNVEYKGKGLQDYYADMWRHLAARFKDHPALFGFDVFNEPFPGKDGGKVFRGLISKLVKVSLFDKDVKLSKLLGDLIVKERRDQCKYLDHFQADVFRKVTSSGDELIKKFDTQRYSPFINKMSSAIREVSDKGILFMENCYYSNLGIPYSAPAIEVNGKRDENFCFSPHGYDLMVDTPAYKYASNSRVGSIFKEHKRSQDRLQAPVMVGEWGGDSIGTDWLPHVQFLLDYFDENKWSNTYWTYVDEILDAPLMKVFSRIYPQAVTGKITCYKNDRDAKIFTLDYDQDKEFDAPSVIYSPTAIKSVKTQGEYKIINIDGCEACLVEIKTGVGAQRIEIKY